LWIRPILPLPRSLSRRLTLTSNISYPSRALLLIDNTYLTLRFEPLHHSRLMMSVRHVGLYSALNRTFLTYFLGTKFIWICVVLSCLEALLPKVALILREYWEGVGRGPQVVQLVMLP
jgi:hypothetical protein